MAMGHHDWKPLRDRVWELVETDIDGYSNLIETLLQKMPVPILRKLVRELEGEEE
jgi:hypothetical protein